MGDASTARRLEFYSAELANFSRGEGFRGWGELMLWYSLGLCAIGVMLRVGVASDVWVYAGAVVAVNLLKLYKSNCTALAPYARGNLSRFEAMSRRFAL